LSFNYTEVERSLKNNLLTSGRQNTHLYVLLTEGHVAYMHLSPILHHIFCAGDRRQAGYNPCCCSLYPVFPYVLLLKILPYLKGPSRSCLLPKEDSGLNPG